MFVTTSHEGGAVTVSAFASSMRPLPKPMSLGMRRAGRFADRCALPFGYPHRQIHRSRSTAWSRISRGGGIASGNVFPSTVRHLSSSSDPTMPLTNVDELVATANAFASTNGILVRQKDVDIVSFTCAPMSLLPNAFPGGEFERAQQLAPLWNVMVDRLSRNYEWLEHVLGGDVADADPFTARLLQMTKQLYGSERENFASSADRLGIFRSDYMLHRSSPSSKYELKQVELNTIAASFAGLASRVALLHRTLTARSSPAVKSWLSSNAAAVGASSDKVGEVPISPALDGIPEAIQLAHQRYQQRFSPHIEPLVLFVVQEGETNTVDQRLLEFALWERGIATRRLSLTAISNGALHLDEGTGALQTLENDQQVSVVYFRAGYAPTDYPSEAEWQARFLLEQSRATKCPCLGYHLAGTKKVQQELARPGVLEQFSTSPQDLRRVFAGLYSLGSDATAEDLAVIRNVVENDKAAAGYVLKPQREGGGYNFYGDDLAAKVRDNVVLQQDHLKLNPELAEYILMERLFPPQQNALLLRNGLLEGSGPAPSVSELGCFGTVLSSADGEILHNEYAGFLLRTKFANVDEGGVASGFATLSSPYLCE